MPIFTSENAKPVKFYMQKDIPAQTIENLTELITQHGGTVQDKVPRQGYILVDTESSEANRLINCWTTDECPKRYFVPYSFVNLCIQEGQIRITPQIFRNDGRSLTMHIHDSVKDKDEVSYAILCSGGNPTASEAEADVIVADGDSSGFHRLVENYSYLKEKYVEDVDWLDDCIQSGKCTFTPWVKKNLGGRVAGSRRNEFTERDDMKLAAYIAARFPDPTMRGRTGNKIYKELCDRVNQYPWATRHPWQSWRERYKNNTLKFNKMIKTYLAKNPGSADNKGAHGFVRPRNASKQPVAKDDKEAEKEKAVSENSENEDDGWGSQWEIIQGTKSPPAWIKRKEREHAEDSSPERSSKRQKIDSQVNVADPVDGSQDTQATNASPQKQQISDENGLNGSGPSSQKGIRSSHQATDIVDDSESDEGASMGTQTQALFQAQKTFIEKTNLATAKEASRSPEAPSTSNLSNNNNHNTVTLVKIASQYGFLITEVTEDFEQFGRDIVETERFFKEIREYIEEKKARRGLS